MTDDEIIEVVQARKAGMRIDTKGVHKSPFHWESHESPGWNFAHYNYRVIPEDAPAWERIKGEKPAEQEKLRNIIWIIREYRNENITMREAVNAVGLTIEGEDPAPDLPPLPEKDLVVLPVGFEGPNDEGMFSGWFYDSLFPKTGWVSSAGLNGKARNNSRIRYAVRPDTDIARLNGVGWGECAPPSFTAHDDSPGLDDFEEWFPINTAPKDGANIIACVAGMKGSVGEAYWHKGLWYTWDGQNHRRTIYFESPTHWMPLPNPPSATLDYSPKPTYGQDLNGNKITPPDDDHEIIPEGTKVHPGEVTHWHDGKRWRPYVDRDSTFTYSKIHNDIRAYARLKYSVLHERSGIQPGDVVEVMRAAEDYERGWHGLWTHLQDKFVGKKATVISDHSNEGFYLQSGSDSWVFPAFVLRKVERVRVPLEASDWASGPWCVRRTGDITIADMVVGVTYTTGAIQTVLFGIRDAKELKKKI